MAGGWGTLGQESIGHGGKVRARSVQSIGHGGGSGGLRKVWRTRRRPGGQDPSKKYKIPDSQNFQFTNNHETTEHLVKHLSESLIMNYADDANVNGIYGIFANANDSSTTIEPVC